MMDTEAPPWSLIYKLRKIRSCLDHTTIIRTISSRANGVAKALASWALSSKTRQIFSHPAELPPSICSNISMDSMAL